MLSSNKKSPISAFEPAVAAEGGEFEPFQTTALKSAPNIELSQRLISGDAAFSIQSDFWTALLKDPWIQREIEQTVNKRSDDFIRSELARRVQEVVPLAEREAREKGYQEGRALGDSESRKKCETEFQLLKEDFRAREETLLNRMNQLSVEVLNAKSKVLKDHERAWSEALQMIISKLPLSPGPGWPEKMDLWLRERLEQFEQGARVTVYLTKEDFKSLEELNANLERYPWIFRLDELLNEGELRIDCGDGGLFFSKAENYKRLVELMTAVFDEKDEPS